MSPLLKTLLCAVLALGCADIAAVPPDAPLQLAQTGAAGTAPPGAAPRAAGTPPAGAAGRPSAANPAATMPRNPPAAAGTPSRSTAGAAGTVTPASPNVPASPSAATPTPVPSAGAPSGSTASPGVTVTDPSAPEGTAGTLEGPGGTSRDMTRRRDTGPATINPPGVTATPAPGRSRESVESDFAADLRSCEGLPPGEKTACRGEAHRRRGDM